MSSPSNPTSSSDQGDPWEQLAEDLFGLEYGKEHGSRESSPPAARPVAAAPPEVVRAQERPEPASTSSAELEQQQQDEPAFAAEPAFEEPEASPEPYSSPELGSPRESVETSPPAVAEAGSPQDSYWDALANWNWDESEGAGSKAKSEAPRSSGGPPPRGGPRGRDARGRDEGRDRRGGDRPQRQASESSSESSSVPAPAAPEARHSSSHQPSAPRAPRSAGAAASDDFGLGVADEPAPAEYSAPKEPRTTEGRRPTEPRQPVSDTTSRDESSKPAPTADRSEHRPSSGERGSGERGTGEGSPKQEEGEFPRKKRRRRRRRSRGGDRGPGSTTGPTTGSVAGSVTGGTPTSESPASDDEWDDSAGPESDDAADEPETPVADSREEIKDKFEGDRHVPARGPRRGPRNDRSRREGPPKRSHSAPSEAARSESRSDEAHGEFEEEPLLVGGGVEESSGEDDAEDDATEQAVSYEDVPSWEEAISYLLHPSQVQVEPGVGNGSAPGRQAPPADQPRQTRHMGGQKPRR